MNGATHDIVAREFVWENQMPTDGLPLSEVAQIDQQIRERIDLLMSGQRKPEDLTDIAQLNHRRAELTESQLFDEARGLLARIAAAG